MTHGEWLKVNGESFEYTKRELDASDDYQTVCRRAEYALMGAPCGPYLV